MDDKKLPFLEKMKTLSKEELVKYESAAIQARRIIDIVGIACLLLALFFPAVYILIICIPAIYFLAKTSNNISISLGAIRDLIQKPDGG